MSTNPAMEKSLEPGLLCEMAKIYGSIENMRACLNDGDPMTEFLVVSAFLKSYGCTAVAHSFDGSDPTLEADFLVGRADSGTFDAALVDGMLVNFPQRVICVSFDNEAPAVYFRFRYVESTGT